MRSPEKKVSRPLKADIKKRMKGNEKKGHQNPFPTKMVNVRREREAICTRKKGGSGDGGYDRLTWWVCWKGGGKEAQRTVKGGSQKKEKADSFRRRLRWGSKKQSGKAEATRGAKNTYRA